MHSGPLTICSNLQCIDGLLETLTSFTYELRVNVGVASHRQYLTYGGIKFIVGKRPAHTSLVVFDPLKL